MKTPQVLVVDDCRDILESLGEMLEIYDLKVHLAHSVELGLIILKEEEIDFIVSDIDMPIIDGLTFYELIQKMGLKIPFAFFSGKAGVKYVKVPSFAKPHESQKLIDYILDELKN